MRFSAVKTRDLLIGTLFILQNQCFVLRHDLVNSSSLTLPPEVKAAACDREVKGEGILIGRIIYSLKQGPNCTTEIYSNSTKRLDTLIWQALSRECNGKIRCTLTDSIKTTIHVECYINYRKQVSPANQIDIVYECKPIKSDNKQVFGITPGFSVNLTDHQHNKSYLVLDLQQASPTEIHCEIDGNKRELKFTILHVDFGPNLDCNRSDVCHGQINVTDDKMKTVNYTYNMLPKEPFNEYLKFVYFNISMSTGLIWIQLEGYKEINIRCQDNKGTSSTAHTTSFSSSGVTATAGHGAAGNTTVEVDAITLDADGTTAEANVTVSVSEQGVPLKVAIPAGVAGLFALLVIALCVACACSANSPLRRWKRSKRRELQEEIRYPLRDEYDYATTNEILDCRPGSPLTAQTKTCPGKDQHHGDNDYMEVNSYEETSLVTTPTSTTALHPRSGSHPGPRLTPVSPDTPTPTGPTAAKWALARSSGLKSPGGPGEAVESTYAMADNDGEPSSEPSVLYSATNAPSAGETTTPKSPGEDTEYSHLNDVTNQRNAENVYDG